MVTDEKLGHDVRLSMMGRWEAHEVREVLLAKLDCSCKKPGHKKRQK